MSFGGGEARDGRVAVLPPGPGLPFPDALDRIPAGPELAAVVTALTTDDQLYAAWLTAGSTADPRPLAQVDADARLALAQAAARLEAWATAIATGARWTAFHTLAAAARDGGECTSGGDATATAELAAALHEAHAATTSAIEDAYLLSRHPGVRWLLTEGHLSPAQARAITDACSVLPDELIPRIETAVLARAPERTPAQLRRATRREVLRHDPRGADRRHADAIQDRSVRLTPFPDGMAEVRALLTAPEAHTLVTALDTLAAGLRAHARAAAHGTDGFQNGLADGDIDSSGVDGSGAGWQRRANRADALAVLAAAVLGDTTTLTGTLADTVTGLVHAAGGTRTAVRVQITADALAGLTDNPAELAGHGPIPAWLGHLLTSGGTDWEAAVTDGAGHLLDIHPLRYQPTPAQRAWLTAKNLTCQFPGCTVPATRSDLDHIIPFNHDNPETGGPTTCDNLCPLCRLHHNLKTWWNWHTQRAHDGTLITTTPLGRIYTTPPPTQPCTSAA